MDTQTHRLAGRAAIVTGGAMGIGRAIVARLAADGAAVVVADRNVDGGAEIARMLRDGGAKVRFVPCDVARSDDVRAVIETTLADEGRLDVLVNDAGIPGPHGPVAELADDD
ncbi:MAG TPA: SDR family NAD(P)-dependent oxidoreductase, partial [Thermomicrobiales bacterium]|nr:SDR family NAD(P)-dependent oxidoreductase [Thermomicrobiales bacterium]